MGVIKVADLALTSSCESTTATPQPHRARSFVLCACTAHSAAVTSIALDTGVRAALSGRADEAT